MHFELEFSYQALEDIEFHKLAGNKSVINKILNIFQDLTDDPFQGIGKPEPLKYNLSGKWSRRITKEHRIIYKVDNSTVYIFSVKGHY